jgi:hypothetical protein
MARVGQNHKYTVCIRYFWQGIRHMYGHMRCIYTVYGHIRCIYTVHGHMRCIYTVLANPNYGTWYGHQ